MCNRCIGSMGGISKLPKDMNPEERANHFEMLFREAEAKNQGLHTSVHSNLEEIKFYRRVLLVKMGLDSDQIEKIMKDSSSNPIAQILESFKIHN
ncbi:MAG TPA: hypothetical protein ENI23_14080 [bacterium]|nr:hypothetical protein [bacterium]